MNSVYRSAFVLAVGLASGTAGHAGIERWTGGGPEGGTVRTLVSDPSMAGRFFAGTVNGPFKSEDGGATWTRVAEGVNNTISGLAIATDGVLYAVDVGEIGDGGALFKSTDAGTSWTELSPPAGNVARVAVAASDSSRVTLGYSSSGIHNVYLSTDGGATFVLSETGLPTFKREIAFHPTDAQIAYCATNLGVYRSTNGGVAWQAHNTGGESSLTWVAVGSTNPDVLLAGSSARTYLSTNAGAGWTEIADVDAQFGLFIAPSNADHMVAIDRDAIFRSTDGGVRWSTLGAFTPTSTRAFAFDRTDPLKLLAGVFSLGAWRSLDGGASWSNASSGINASSLWHKSVRSTSDRAYNWDGLIKTTDAGDTWSPIYDGQPGTNSACSVDPTDAEHLVCVGANLWLFETTDGGASWVNRTPNPFEVNEFYEVAIDPQNPQRWGLGSLGLMLEKDLMDGTLAFSQDSGATWQSRVLADPALWLFYYAFSIRYSPVDPNLIWAAGGGFRLSDGETVCWVQRSLDGGITWLPHVELGTGSCFMELRVDPATPQNVYVVGTMDGGWAVHRSTNSGQSWAPLDTPTSAPLSIAVNPINGELYVGGDALYRSSDGGATWSEFSTAGLSEEVRFVSYVDVSATNPPTIWTSTNAGSFSFTGFGQPIFTDGFESGDTTAWSVVVP